MPHYPLQPIVAQWCRILQTAADHKKEEFGEDADLAMKFFDGPHDFIYSSGAGGAMYMAGEDVVARPSFRMTVNKVAEMVQLFGPHLYHRNPHRQVNPRQMPELPPELFGQGPEGEAMAQMVEQQNLASKSRHDAISALMSAYLNYTPNETDLKSHSRMWIDETIIKGMSCEWTEVFTPPGSQTKIIRSVFDSVNNLLADPDAKSLLDAKWIARRREMPVWEAERLFGHPRGTLKGTKESLQNKSAYEGADSTYWRAQGDTNDLITFFEVYSRMGMGHRIRKPYNPPIEAGPPDEWLDGFGDYVYLAISKEHPWPLNMPEAAMNSDEAFMRAQWPTPFWADPYSPWPFTGLAFHKRPNKLWPMSHLKPALGELMFLDWAFSFLADKIKNTSRDFLAMSKSAGEDLKSAVLSGRDLTLLEIEGSYKTVGDVVEFLQHPQMNKDIFTVIEYVVQLFEQRTGLTELLAAGHTSKQLRSAREASIKGEMTRIRPDDMASMVESAATEQARKEAIAARWHLSPRDVVNVVGPVGAQLWGEVVSSADLPQIVAELEYRIEAGSIRKPNVDRDVENAQQAAQVWGQVWKDYAFQTGDFGPLNQLWTYWAKSHQMTDAENYILQPPPPQEGPSPEELKMQAEMQKLEVEKTKAQLDLQMKQEEHALKQAEAEAEQQRKTQQFLFDMRQDDVEHRQDLAHSEEEHDQQLAHEREQARLKMELMEREGTLKLRQARQQKSVQKNGAKT